MRYAVLVCGPAGVGKSTFCNTIITHARANKRTIHLFNLDPAAEAFEYEPTVDIRELVTLSDVMSEHALGPNGGLVFCFEYLLQNFDWLSKEIGDYDDDYLIIDCPGQIELYSHVPVLPELAKHLAGSVGMNVSAAYLLDSQFMEDPTKYFSGVLSAMSCMVALEVPFVNIMSKMDLVKKGARHQRRSRDVDSYLSPDPQLLRDSVNATTNERFHFLNEAIATLIEDFNVVQFLPLDVTDEESVEMVLSHIDYALQYGEHEEPKEIEGPEGDTELADPSEIQALSEMM